MTPDLVAARAFLAALTGEEGATTPVTFQTFDDTDANRRFLACIRHGSLEQHGAELARLNAQGAGVFVAVNATNLRGRSAEHIVSLRALFIDCDGPRKRVLARPTSITVATSADRRHYYWLLDDGEPLDGFREAQQHLASYYGSDPHVCDLPRVMRLPGFFHCKRDPRQVTLMRADATVRAPLRDIIAAHPLPLRRASLKVWTSPVSCDAGHYSQWARSRRVIERRRNTTAYSIAAEGFRRGVSYAEIAHAVTDYCDRAGISREASSVIRSACRGHVRRAAGRSPA